MQKNELPSVGSTFDCSQPEHMAMLMNQWWAGVSHAEMAAHSGLTPQRVGQLLAQVGCTAEILRKAKQGPDSPRQAVLPRVEEARYLLQHPLAAKLTVRQRGALLWRAQGLILSDIARRMATTVQAVQYFIVGAGYRLERLELQESSRVDANPADVIDLDLDDLMLSDSSVPEEAAASEEPVSQVEYDEPGEAEEAVEAEEPEPEIDVPPVLPSPPLGQTVEKKPIRLSELRAQKPARWVKLWSSNDPL